MSEFVFVSGRRCLDFVGTLLWRRTLRTELLATPDDLQAWAQQGHLVDHMVSPSRRDFDEALTLREAVYRLVQAATAAGAEAGPTDHEIDLLNSLASGPLPTVSLVGPSVTRSQGSFANVASLLARDVIELVGSEDLAKVKECANTDCTRLFVDHSRGMSRRWCGMAECGNKAKAAMYRQRKKLRDNA